MKCERCHEIVRPVVLVDIDGTLADYHNPLFRFCVDYWDVWEREQVACQWDGGGNFEDFLGLTQEEYREAKLAFRQGGAKRSMPLYNGAKQFVNRIHNLGCDVWLTTTRPWQRLDNVDPDTVEWLRRNGIRYNGLLYDEFKYSRILEIIDKDRIVGVVDDLPEQWDHANEMGLPVWQVERLHNSHVTQRRQPRGSLQLASEWIDRNLTEWREKNGA